MSSDGMANSFLTFGTTEEVTGGLNDFILNFSVPDELIKDTPFQALDVTSKLRRSVKNYKGRSARSYDCPYCSVSLLNSSNLQSHLRVHTGERPFKCHLCTSSFSQSSNLKSHLKTHTGEKPFICTVCDKAFARSSHLNGHLKTHTGEMNFECHICTKKFYTSTRLKNHMLQRHQPSSQLFCGVCEESFVNRDALALHLQMHKGDRPFKCNICSAGFRSKEDHRIHLSLHGDSCYKYQCPKCTKKFQIKLCCEIHVAKCPSNVAPLNYDPLCLDEPCASNIEVSTMPIDTNAASNEIVIHVGEEKTATDDDDDDNVLEDDILNFPEYLQQFIYKTEGEGFNIQFKSEQDLGVYLLDDVDVQNAFCQESE